MKRIFFFLFFATMMVVFANAQQQQPFVGPENPDQENLEQNYRGPAVHYPCPDCPPCPKQAVVPKKSYSSTQRTSPGNINQSQDMANDITIIIDDNDDDDAWPYGSYGDYRMFPPYYGGPYPEQPYYPGKPGAPGYYPPPSIPSLPAGPSVWQEFRGSPVGKGILNWILPLALLAMILLALFVLGKKLWAWGKGRTTPPAKTTSIPPVATAPPGSKTARSEKEIAAIDDLMKTAKERGGTFKSYPDNGYSIQIPPAAAILPTEKVEETKPEQ